MAVWRFFEEGAVLARVRIAAAHRACACDARDARALSAAA